MPGRGSRIVLVGGGHAHVHVMADFGDRPVPGARVTLVTRDLETPYSGMLPGLVAGFYRHEEAHIDLKRLAAATGVDLVHAAATGLDRQAREVVLEGGGRIAYDLVSLDIGITPELGGIEGAAEHAVAVKPIGRFIEKFEALLEACKSPIGPRRIAVVGGGAGGVELILSLRARILAEAAKAGLERKSFAFVLASAEPLLSTHNGRVRAAFARVLAEKGIELHENARVAAIGPDSFRLEDGTELGADAVLVATDAAPAPWFAATGLALDGGGFVAVGPTLQSLNDAAVLAAGDCAGLVETPREKAGVYAVRAGPPLAANLRALATGGRPEPWRPQRRHLALISTGEKYAIASRGPFKAEGAWLWHLKDWIDRRWVTRYQRG